MVLEVRRLAQVGARDRRDVGRPAPARLEGEAADVGPGDAEQVEAIVHRTAHGGAEIVKLLGTGSAYYAPGSAVVEMVEAVLKDKKKILPCSVFLQGEYGVQDLFVGVPCKLGANGLEGIIEITLTPDEDAALQKSAEAVRELVEIINV